MNIKDKNGDSLLHYSSIGQGNATLYIKYLVEKHGMSVLMKNTNRLTPRQHAQRADRFKFHRVIKALREIEEKEQNITKILDEDDAKVVKETEEERQKRIRKAEDD